MTLCLFRLRPARMVRAAAAAALVCLFVLASAVPSFAAGGQAGNINGTVVDAQTGAPLAGVTVGVVSPSGSFRVTSDAKGFFSILGATVDTYTVSIEAKGYEPQAVNGVTVIGDQTINVGTVKLSKSLRPIARVTARSIASAFQPGQTVDSVTISGARIEQSTGKAASNDEQSLVLAAPGTSVTQQGDITIRGGLATEVGYQFDGIPYTEPFFSKNSSAGYFNGLGSLQVVEGAGDATQGNIGGGVVNIIPKRGTYPGSGLVDFEAGTPNFNHQFAFEYGLASANGRISDYFAYNGQRYDPYYGYRNADAASLGNYYANAFQTNDDLVNNFVFKFGKNNNQSLQFLYQNRLAQSYGPAGGSANQLYYPYDPASYLGANGAEQYFESAYGPAAGLKYFQNIIGLNQGVPATGTGKLQQAELTNSNPTQLMKFEYDWNITPSTILQARYFNFFSLANTFTNTGAIGGNTAPLSEYTGGRRSGFIADLQNQFGQKHTVTLHAEYQNQDPIWDDTEPQYVLMGELSNNAAPATTAAPSLVGTVPSLADFLTPVNGTCPVVGGCYLAKYFPNGIPRVPIPGINYHGSLFQTSGIALRDQWNVNDRLKLDYGVRLDAANYKIAPNPINAGLPFYSSNPSDVAASAISSQYNNPRVFEPRFSFAYRMSPNDSFRAGYGRSVEFLNAQTYGTPGALYNYAPFQRVPAINAANSNCGSGSVGAQYSPTCLNYAQQLFWMYDQQGDAPDLGNARYAAYNNYDATYQHQFKNGWGLRATPFYRLGTNIPGFAILSATINPITQQLQSYVFTVNNNNLSRTTGAELEITTPDRPYGLSGFLSMTYQNVLDRVTPLLTGEDALPSVFDTSIALGDTFRAGYVSPFVARLGAEFKTKGGLRINPILNYVRGYPYTLGQYTASNGFCNSAPANVPQVNFGCGSTYIPGFQGVSAGFSQGGATSTNYVDPAFPGNTNKPNIAATRGTPQTAAAGGVLSKPQLSADIALEYKLGKRSTVGIFVQNALGNQYLAGGGNNVVNGFLGAFSGVPQINPFYQPVSTGVAGPQTGQNALANPNYAGGIYQNRGEANAGASVCGTCPYVLVPTAPTRFTFYYQLAL